MEQIEEIIGDASSRGREFLLGRMGHIKKAKSTGECSSAATSKITNISEEALQEIKSIVREEVKTEVTEEVGKSMQAQLGAIIHRLCRKNPSLNLNLDGVLSSDSDSSPSDVGEE